MQYKEHWDDYALSVQYVDRTGSSELVRWVVKFPFPFYNREYVYRRWARIEPSPNGHGSRSVLTLSYVRCPLPYAQYAIRNTKYPIPETLFPMWLVAPHTHTKHTKHTKHTQHQSHTIYLITGAVYPEDDHRVALSTHPTPHTHQPHTAPTPAPRTSPRARCSLRTTIA